MNQSQREETFSRLVAKAYVEDRVPAAVVEAARSSYAWMSVDDELAALTFDSSDDLSNLAGVRGGSTRQLTFTTGSWTIEVELRDARLLRGQVMPTGPTEVELVTERGTSSHPTDDLGRFAVDDVPSGPVRLRLLLSGGRSVRTDWFLA